MVGRVFGRRSALVVVADEVDPVVADLRRELDPSARLGVPAHVTVLFPFVACEAIDRGALSRLADLFASVPAFDHSFCRTDWFEHDVLWLASDADAQFRALTGLVADAFPEHPPYGGQFDDVVPHLTIADRGPLAAMRAAERRLQPHLPIASSTCAITLLEEQHSGFWAPAATLALGG